MKKRSFLGSLLLCFAAFGGSRPACADDLLDRLQKEGWTAISPGVMQRTLEGGKVETLGFGAEGLRFRLGKLRTHLAFLRQEFARHPSRQLRQAIRVQRAEVLRVEEALKKVDAGGGLESSPEGILATGTNCPVNYDAVADAHPLATGNNSTASAFFDNACGNTGEVYVQTYTRATTADNKVFTGVQNDPTTAPGTPRIGGKVSAAASVGVSGVKDCYSTAYASVTSYDAGEGITYAVSDTNNLCGGPVAVRPFAGDAPSNVTLPASPPVDPKSGTMLATLNGGYYHVNLYNYGIPVFDASAGTSRAIVCTEPWGTCGLSGRQVPVNPSWKPSSGGNRAMTVIDYTTRKVYDFHQVATNPDGTVKINSNGTVSTGWGGVSDLDGDGRSPGYEANLSHLFGVVRVFEMARAASDPVNAIRHALAFGSQYVCATDYRYPATRGVGSFAGVGCIPVGSRVFLDSSTDCSIVSPTGEKAVCYALKKYGAYAVSQAGAAFSLQFETPTAGQPGGSGADPYPGVGFTGDYYGLSSIPWAKLKVAKDCQCSPSDLASASGRLFAGKAPVNVELPASPSLDPGSAAMLASLNGGYYYANLYNYGSPVFDASVGTSRTIACTLTAWGTCGLAGKQVRINPAWKPSRGGDRAMTVIDTTNRKVYDFYQVAVNTDGTVKINTNGTVSTGWGAVSDLDGDGRSPDYGANLSHLFGVVRVFEMARAASDPANAIQHALAFGSQYVCDTAYRYPATRENGSFAGADCIPAGTRVFLDSSTDCSIVSPTGEKAVCYALKKYGAYAVSHTGAAFTLQFETPTAGQPGGSKADPYPGVGFTGDYYNLSHIPWAKLKVAKDCQCTPY